MKKLIYGGLFLIFFNVNFAYSNNQVILENRVTVTSTMKSSEILLTYEINRADLEKELSTLIDDKFNENFIKENPYAYVTITPSRNPEKIIVTIQSDGKPVTPVEMVVCKGGGLSFVNCCKAYLNEHPKGCLKITRGDNDIYYANNDC